MTGPTRRWLARLLCGCAALALFVAIPSRSALTAPRGQSQSQSQPAAADLVFDLNPADTKVNFTLSATMHSVHGTFRPSGGRAEYSTATGALRGEFVVDARSGASGDSGRDKNMHKEVLESEKYPTITFRADRVEGKVSPSGESTVQVHGTFSVHGADHELTIPAQAKVDGGHWTATAKFSVPYVDWGMKNPSTFMLHVGKSVDIEIAATGTVTVASPQQ